jgi:carbon-monoxide dehydrogenase small subunit
MNDTGLPNPAAAYFGAFGSRNSMIRCPREIPREGRMKVSMTVNGEVQSGEIEGRTLLVQFLRETLGLTGTHVGCDTSQCGACLVHVDGEAVKSCTTFTAMCDGAEVTTIEGIAAADGTLSLVQQAFQDHHGLQCGFCTPGMVMSAAALLKDNPKPSEAEIRHHLEGNICRCTGYHNIVKAILAASGQDVASIAAE